VPSLKATKSAESPSGPPLLFAHKKTQRVFNSHQFRCGDDVTVPNGTDLRQSASAACSNENERADIKTVVLSSLSTVRCRSRAPL
jgi:hypothetical protein